MAVQSSGFPCSRLWLLKRNSDTQDCTCGFATALVLGWLSAPLAGAFFCAQLAIDLVPSRLEELLSSLSRYNDDYVNVRGQEMAPRAVIIPAAGSRLH
jgi:hypothetical protein